MNSEHQPKTISSKESDILPPIEEKLKQFFIDKKRRWCCARSSSPSFFTKPFLFFNSGTFHGDNNDKCRPQKRLRGPFKPSSSSTTVSWSRFHFIIHQFVLFFFFRLKAIQVLSLKCLLFLVIVLTVLQNCVSAKEQQQSDNKDEKLPPDRFYDKDFLPNNQVYNRNVTCGKQSKTIFPARTWTCANIRVNGQKIAYGHYPIKSGYPQPFGRCYETMGSDDMGGICLGLMENVNETAKLWVASVTNATCRHSKGQRVYLTIDGSSTGVPQYVWVELAEGLGWVETLHCLTLPDGY